MSPSFETSMSHKREQVLALAREGFHLFPIKPGTKDKPLVPWVKGGHGKHATDEATVVAEWWTKWPKANIGIATEPSGLLVVDIDMKKGKNGQEALKLLEKLNDPLPPTREVHTPTGGFHKYFRVGTPVRSTVNLERRRIGDGIDIRSGGGMVVAPDSVTAAGSYTWGNPATPIADAPDWLVKLCTPKPAGSGNKVARKKKVGAAPPSLPPLIPLDGKEALERAIHFLAQHPVAIEGQGGDMHTFKTACQVKDFGISRERCLRLLLDHWNDRCRPPWSEAGLNDKVTNAYEYGENPPGAASPLAHFKVLDSDEAGETLQQVLDRWVWVVEPSCFIRRTDCQMWNREQFESLYSHLVEKGSLWNTIIKSEASIRRFERVTYQPGKPEFPEDGRYNIWRPSGVEPKPGDVAWFLNHMIYLLPDEDERRQVLDYLAYLVQQPGQKIHFALVLQGRPGTGKSFLGYLMERIIGRGNTSRPSNDELHSTWTTWQRQAQLVVVEELMTIGRQELINKLKSVITDETLRIHTKFQNTYSLNNCLNFLMFTNHKDALKIELNDRRFFVMFSPAQPAIESYYTELFAHLKGDGPAHVAHSLSQRDLSNFYPKGQAPWTTAKQEMRNATMDEVHQYFIDMKDNGEPPFHFDLLSMSDVEYYLPLRLTQGRNFIGRVTAFLRDHLSAVRFEQVPVEKGKHKANLWAWQNEERWKGMTKADMGRRYDARPRPSSRNGSFS